MAVGDLQRKLILTVVGARPQFIKAASLSRRLAQFPKFRELIIHTGQHYDYSMSKQFFDELGIPSPHKNLEVGSGPHGAQTGQIMAKLEQLLPDLRPDLMVTYGDTNSTLAAALVAAKGGVPLVHVEAGLRSFRRAMPEEVNRVATDHLADYLFCPSETSARQLRREGITRGVYVTGDIMFDGFLHTARTDEARAATANYGVEGRRYILATVHRAENTDDPRKLRTILSALGSVAADIPVILPLHPRTEAVMKNAGVRPDDRVRIVPPCSYASMVGLVNSARIVATDSGGLQKEAYFAAVPCVTLREETEWIETLQSGWNRLAPPSDGDSIVLAIRAAAEKQFGDVAPEIYGDGDSAGRILQALSAHF